MLSIIGKNKRSGIWCLILFTLMLLLLRIKEECMKGVYMFPWDSHNDGPMWFFGTRMVKWYLPCWIYDDHHWTLSLAKRRCIQLADGRCVRLVSSVNKQIILSKPLFSKTTTNKFPTFLTFWTRGRLSFLSWKSHCFLDTKNLNSSQSRFNKD